MAPTVSQINWVHEVYSIEMEWMVAYDNIKKILNLFTVIL